MLDQSTQIVIACTVEQVVGKRRARCNRLDHLTLDDTLGEFWVFSLLTDRDTETLLDEAAQVFSRRFHRHARQGNFTGPAVIPGCKGEAECLRRYLGIFVKHFVEITHPEE